MILMHVLGAALVIAACTAAGWKKSAGFKEKVVVLYQLQQMIGMTQGEILYRRSTLPDLLKQLKEEHSLDALNLKECTDLREYTLPSCLSENERKKLLPFFQSLGSSTSEEFIENGMYFQKICAELLEEARIKSRNAEKLYTQLGICSGAILAIILF